MIDPRFRNYETGISGADASIADYDRVHDFAPLHFALSSILPSINLAA
jgi:hypothetical protein